MTTRRYLGILASGMTLTGCAVETPDGGAAENVGHGLSALSVDNALSANALPMNGLIANLLSTNALAQNALAQNGVLANGAVSAALADGSWAGEMSRQFFHYAVTCALGPWQAVSYYGPWGWVTEYGQLGYVPAWESEGMDDYNRRLVSACMLARVNLYGVSVPISVRRYWEQPDPGYEVFEGAFVGNLFDTQPWGCSAQGWGHSYAYKNKLRACTTVSCGLLQAVWTDIRMIEHWAEPTIYVNLQP